MDWQSEQKRLDRQEKYQKERDAAHDVHLLGENQQITDPLDIELLMEYRALVEDLHLAIREVLSEYERELILCIYFGEMSIREFAKTSHIAYSTVREHHQKAVDKLRCYLESLAYDAGYIHALQAMNDGIFALHTTGNFDRET